MQAWMGEGSLKVLNASVNPDGRDESWLNEIIGEMGVESDCGVWMVIECFCKNSSASFGDIGVAPGCDCEDDAAGDDEPAAGEVSC